MQSKGSGQIDSPSHHRQLAHLARNSSPADPSGVDLLLVNPAAGGGRALRVVPALEELARQRNWKIEICVTRGADELAAKAREAAGRSRRRILVLGGDGTFQVLVNALKDFPETILGVIPAGGGNDLAAALGLSQNVVHAASQIQDGEVCWLDAVKVRLATGEERLYTGGGGVGLDAEAAFYAGGVFRKLRGRSRYLLAALRALLGFRSVPLSIRIAAPEPIQIETTALVVGVLNTPTYGAGLCLAPGALTDDGRLDLVVLGNLSFFEILALFPSLATRGELKSKRVQRFRIEKVHIETHRPRWFHGDGELLGKTPVEVTVEPRAIRILRPRRSGANSLAGIDGK